MFAKKKVNFSIVLCQKAFRIIFCYEAFFTYFIEGIRGYYSKPFFDFSFCFEFLAGSLENVVVFIFLFPKLLYNFITQRQNRQNLSSLHHRCPYSAD